MKRTNLAVPSTVCKAFLLLLFGFCCAALASPREMPVPRTPASSVHTYIVTHPETGQSLMITGSTPPTEETLDIIFSETIGYAGMEKGDVIVKKTNYKIIDSVLQFARGAKGDLGVIPWSGFQKE